MYHLEIRKSVEKIFFKLAKKDPEQLDAISKKIDEIIHANNVKQYKNLRYNMNDSKRGHIGHFVLIFQYKKEEDLILFDDFDHHDTIYK